MRVLLTLPLIAGCLAPPSQARRPPPPAEPVPTVRAVPSSEVVVAMHRQLALVGELRAAVVRGDLEATRQPARTLASLPPIKGAPAEWTPWLLRFKDAAARVDDIWRLDTAARAVADIGRTCGGCHQHLGGGPTYPGDGDAGVPAEGLDGHMQHHAAAMDRMWEGLITADALHFARAAGALSQAGQSDGATSGPIDQRVHALAEDGAKARSLSSRADVYGSLLTLCAECHAARDAQ